MRRTAPRVVKTLPAGMPGRYVDGDTQLTKAGYAIVVMAAGFRSPRLRWPRINPVSFQAMWSDFILLERLQHIEDRDVPTESKISRRLTLPLSKSMAAW